MIQPKYHVFVCASCRVNGTQKGFCHSKGSVGLIQRFMQEIATGFIPGTWM
jgi:predicted metal-binding protein